MKYKVPPAFSIILPVFNAEATIVLTLESVFRQSYRNFELIIINDGSDDNSENLIKETIQNQNNVLYLKQENMGVAATRNKALRLAKGEYFAFLDSDDLWNEEKLGLFYSVMKSNPSISVFYSDYQIIAADGRKLFKQYPPFELNYKLLLRRNYIALSSAVIRRNAVNGITFKHSGHEDYRFWLDVLAAQKLPVSALKVESEVPLTMYRLSASSLSKNKIKAIQWHWSILSDQNINIISKCFYFFNYALHNVFKLIKIKIYKKKKTIR